jgi:hypothetical protein
MISALSEANRARARALANNTQPGAVGGLMLDGLPVGEAALSGALRFFARGELEDGEAQAAVLKRYLEASCLALFAMRKLIAQERYDVVIGHHGIYVPQALVAFAAHEAGVRFVAWNPAYRTGCFIFSHDETYHRAMLTEPVSTWEGLRLTSERWQVRAGPEPCTEGQCFDKNWSPAAFRGACLGTLFISC